MQSLSSDEIIQRLKLVAVSYDEVLALLKRDHLFFPAGSGASVDVLEGYSNEEEYFEDYRRQIYFSADDLVWSDEWNFEWNDRGMLVTAGSFTCVGYCRVDFFSAKDAVVDGLAWSSFQRSLSQIRVNHLDVLANRDDESHIRFPPWRSSEAPMVLLYYADIQTQRFEKSSVVIWIDETDRYEHQVAQHPQYTEITWIRGLFAPVVFDCLVLFTGELSDSAIGHGAEALVEHLQGKRNVLRPDIQLSSVREMQSAYASHMQKDFKSAALGYKEVLMASPGFSLAYRWLIEILIGLEDYAKVLAVAKSGIHVEFPKNVFSTNPVGSYGSLSALALGDLKLAEQFSQIALKHNDSDVRALRSLGEVMIRKQDLAGAQVVLSKACAVNRTYGAAAWLLGLCQHLSNQPQEAEQTRATAIMMDARFDHQYDREQTTGFLFAPKTIDWFEW